MVTPDKYRGATVTHTLNQTNSKTPTMEPSILSTSNLPFIAVAVVIAMVFVMVNIYLNKKALKH